MTPPIYLDHHATTPCDPRVVEAILPFFTREFGNPSSRTHPFGERAREACENARAEVARLIGARPEEIVFTSGATESDNIALRGILCAAPRGHDHLVTTTIEHHAVLDPARSLESIGARVTRLPVDGDGLADPDAVRDAITGRTALVSVMMANNEVGTIEPIAEIGAICREAGVPFHCDAAQAAGKVPIDCERLGADLLSLSAHKLYGPKGVGALYVRRGEGAPRPAPIMDGGGQEGGLRPGTLNVPGIVGLGAAARIAREEMEEEGRRTAALRDRLWEAIRATIPEVRLNGHPQRRLPGNLHVSFEAVDGDSLLSALPDVALSSGSACASEGHEPSHVLRVLGLPAALARGSVRFGIGRWNTEEEIDRVAARVAEEVARLREISPLWDRGS